jgi:thiol-disulfide isomerase/thioredoxin
MMRWGFVAALFCFLSGMSLEAAELPATLALTDLKGQPIELSQAKDKVLMVFWATWCDECRAKLSHELPELNSRKDVSVITVNTDKDEDRVREFVAKEKVQVPVYRDNSKNLRKELKIFSVPYWAIYKKNPVTGGRDLIVSDPAFDYERILKLLGAS